MWKMLWDDVGCCIICCGCCGMLRNAACRGIVSASVAWRNTVALNLRYGCVAKENNDIACPIPLFTTHTFYSRLIVLAIILARRLIAHTRT